MAEKLSLEETTQNTVCMLISFCGQTPDGGKPGSDFMVGLRKASTEGTSGPQKD